ncbi:enoyl-CoA hydratase/isomerase family protein [soil metagenome]
MPHDESPILTTLEAGVATIRFNRPQAMNALDVPMAEALLATVTALRANPDARVIVLCGAGKVFMAGGDLQTFFADLPNAPATARALIDPLHEALALLAEGDAPVIASLHGAVAGAGLSISLGADLAIAADDTRFTLAYSRIGANVDGGGSWALPRTVGLKKAMEIALLSDMMSAATALELGLVNQIVPPAELEAATLALAPRLAQGPTGAYGRIKRLLRASLQRPLREQMAAEREAFVEGASTADFAEGLAAFFGKRPATFTGR